MSYQALYRKFRPQTFEQVKGQDAIVTTLKNQVIHDRIGHAYLFCGTRGTGKTSVAKLFAKTVNCENPKEGSPCGECPQCQKIAAGISMNVIEMDAASNNSVEDVRQIVDGVTYSPTEGRYKVYIIDEVHMLSNNAFNALLKTLEEPPSYVVFILATTEIHKIPITILSRCQRYDFKRISIDTISDRLRELSEKEGLQVEEKALRYIAKCADGSMRDALSLLDQCSAFYLGQELTYDRALTVLGAVDNSIYSELLRMIVKKDITGAIHKVEDMVMLGRELNQFITDFVWYLRNLLLVKTASGDIEDVIDVTKEHKQLLEEEAKMLETPVLMRYIRVLSELSGQLRFSTQKRVQIEMAIIKLCRPAMETDLESLTDRIRHLEEKIESGNFVVSAAPASSDASARSEAEQAPRQKVPMPKAIPEDIRKVAKGWLSIKSRLDGLEKSLANQIQPTVENDKLFLVTSDTSAYDYFCQEGPGANLKRVIEEMLEKEIEFELRLLENGQVFEEHYPDLVKGLINMEIEMED